MFQRYISRRRKFSILSFIVAMSVLLYFSYLSVRQVRLLQATERQVAQSYERKVLLEKLLSYTKDAEAGLLGYAATKDDMYLKRGETVRTSLDNTFRGLDSLTQEGDSLQKHLAEIRLRYNNSLDSLSELKTHQPALAMSNLHGLQALRSQINGLMTAEDKLLQQRNLAYKREATLTPYIAFLLLAFSMLKFLISFYVINNDYRKINRVSNELKLMNDSFEHAEEIAQISHWQWDLQTNRKLFSDNQYRMLGCQPGEFEPTFENYAQYIHPDDREQYMQDKQNLLENKQANDRIYRIIRKDGELRYFKSTGRLQQDEQGKKVIVGVKYDITEQHLVRKELEERNLELTNKNIELASFNYIASHDLQEPLRKIQLFVSKILDDSNQQLSEKNTEYFARMQTSANRMQHLIEDLLTYSRANSGDGAKETCDLNDIVGSVREEILASDVAQNKGITINMKDLPSIQGVPFQLKQLFSNLTDNSVKYRNLSKPLVINIEASLVTASPLLNEHRSDEKRMYHKITLSDNGIGFEPQYAKQIFTLFQRLHDSSTYSGTGIGLAICKKVAENHNGFIIANGKPNEGATFDIYLPADV